MRWLYLCYFLLLRALLGKQLARGQVLGRSRGWEGALRGLLLAVLRLVWVVIAVVGALVSPRRK